jgi:photosystem II stability/assembly factor-like uncharacterized protein
MFRRPSIECLQRTFLMLVFPLAVASCDGDNRPTAPGGGGPTTPSGWFWQNPLPQGATLLAVHFVNATTGTAVGESGTILRTTDGGSSWVSQTSGTTEWLFGVSFTDARTGTAVGTGGTILRTTNGGSAWK